VTNFLSAAATLDANCRALVLFGQVGEKVVQYAMWGESDAVAIERTGYYSVDYRLVPLEAVAGKTRTLPDEYISANGTEVTDAFRLYLRPLLGKAMPDAYRPAPKPSHKDIEIKPEARHCSRPRLLEDEPTSPAFSHAGILGTRANDVSL
jgi:hypothetical protein